MTQQRSRNAAPELADLLEFADLEGLEQALSSNQFTFASPSLRPFLIAAVIDQARADTSRAALVVAGDDAAAQGLAGDLASWLSPREVRFFPSRGVAYESHLSPPPHLVGLRVAAVDALTTRAGEGAVVVASAQALAELIPDPALRPQGFKLEKGGLLDLDELTRDLVAAGYERVDQVSERGQFAVRGGIVDIYPATSEHAARVELFDIEIESLRFFSTFTQRSLGEADEIEIAPCAELSIERRQAAELAAAGEERPDIAELLPLDQFSSLLELVSDSVDVVVAAHEEVAPALEDRWNDITAAFHSDDAHQLYIAPADVISALEGRAAIVFSATGSRGKREFRAERAEYVARSPEEAEPQLEKLINSKYRTVVTWQRRGDGERAAYSFARLQSRWLGDPSPRGEIGLEFAQASLREGFVCPSLKLAVIPEHRLIKRRKPKVAARRRSGVLRSFADLRTGDIVVHEDHGIARFAGFETRDVAGITRDYLYLEFAGTDKVFVPGDQLEKLSRYVGADTENPPLSKLGGKRWDQQRARARHAAQELAGDLLNLLAERRVVTGREFPPDGEWQRDFESKVPFTETTDQLDAIEAVKADMESKRPMDRLLCGDVGFGKTEVALRAAFKAASDGQQVMVLAPTTILAQQHFGSFAERFKDFPFTIDHVSRFRSAAQQKAALDGFASGKVDVIIGTHRLLSRDVNPKQLGLIVIDEEQRFGVKQKELLRQLKGQVDVLSMSATPIPRSMQMALAGLRDISTIETPPEGRRAVKTYVGEYEEDLVRQAIERELSRDGQAFFVHNRVESIDETAERVRAMVPKARVAVAHGQLDEDELEERMLLFLRGEADVLVCTSIVESGLDIPSANTLIVEAADQFGLAQLHQLRGRVGRSDKRAYAYLLYPSAGALSEQAAQRLAALADHTELGAGLRIALRDLEIRGAGNLLGDEQSGHVAALGFELYLRMLEDAVDQLKSRNFDDDDAPREPVRLDVNVDAFVPSDYIAYEEAKIDVHRRIAGAREIAELNELRAELADRFGEPPEPVENLISLQEVRVKLGRAGARAIAFKQDRLAVQPIDLTSVQVKRLRAKIPEAMYEPGRAQLSLRVPGEGAKRFPAVIKLADTLLEAVEADTGPE